MDVAGIYIHVPFCRKACNYCNFHFSTSLKYKSDLVNAILTEIDIKGKSGSYGLLQSIYFGGGTPSLLSIEELEQILNRLSNYYEWDIAAEITLEANPEDVSSAYLKGLRTIGINRLSVGIQSFLQEDLIHMNRAHNVDESLKCIGDIKEAGFENYTIDLMFGLINSSSEKWRDNIEQALSFDPPHISCYNLTLEEQTVYAKWQKDGKLNQGSEGLQKEQYEMAHLMLSSAGYDHYEVSNYAKSGFQAVHNSNYWNRLPYEGFGPSAHSYGGERRSWNIANNALYIKQLNMGELPAESEQLEIEDYYNELIMLGLRTAAGINKAAIEDLPDYLQAYWKSEVSKHLQSGVISNEGSSYRLHKDAWYVSDHIAAELFYSS